MAITGVVPARGTALVSNMAGCLWVLGLSISPRRFANLTLVALEGKIKSWHSLEESLYEALKPG